MRQQLLALHHISKTFVDGGEKRTILDDVCLEVHEGELIAIVGPSGSGKSTLLNITGIMLEPEQGQVFLNGKNMTDKKKKEWTKIRKNEIGFIFQHHQLLPYLTAEDQLSVFGKRAKKSAIDMEQMMEDLGIAGCKKRYPAQLSGGERQRVAIARAFVNDPSIILADEPTASLDETRGRQVVEMIREQIKKHKKAGIIVTHDKRVLDLVDRIYYLENGVCKEQA